MIRTAKVHVWLTEMTSPVIAGEFTHDAGTRTGRFVYGAEYLKGGYPALSPDLPLRSRPVSVVGGTGIFPLFLDAGPDAWGRHLLARRLEHDVDEMEALTLCATDGVGNIALGELSDERSRVLSMDEFLAILGEIESGTVIASDLEAQVLDAVQNGTSLGGTKPKLTISRDNVHYLAKFPEPGDSRWLPHIESAMLKLGRQCGIRTCDGEVWHLPGGQRAALLVKRFDRETTSQGIYRRGFVSAHALLRLDLNPPSQNDTLTFATQGFSLQTLRKSYVSLASDMLKWCGSQEIHREERRELWRRIVFNALIRNSDDHSKNHGLLCDDMRKQHWRLAPAFDLVAPISSTEHCALAMAYRYVPAPRRGPSQAPRLVTRVSIDDLIASACEHYGYVETEAREYLLFAASQVTSNWQTLMVEEGMPADEVGRFKATFSCAATITGLTQP
ncbi:MAG: type II toxin-antitoxin system HipA family toxin [Betaproteobacteria bacterium HGW-Betaproteobacteria-10]|nr:MAG: type II toxin-antitoxin system HipA family toxin [Betaproteobacteria bacterium HGW-Betaproteobacteria-10]